MMDWSAANGVNLPNEFRGFLDNGFRWKRLGLGVHEALSELLVPQLPFGDRCLFVLFSHIERSARQRRSRLVHAG